MGDCFAEEKTLDHEGLEPFQAFSVEEMDMRLRFETLLSELSTHFINLPPDCVDGEICGAQRRICEMLQIDLSALWQWTGSPDSLVLTHLYRPLGGPPVPEPAESLEMFPWCMSQLKEGKTVIVSVEDLPPEAAVDQQNWRHFGIRNALAFPLSSGETGLFGALSFNDVQKDRDWSEALVRQLGLVAQIFAGALARRHSDEMLRESRERLEMATESAGAGLWSLDLKTCRVWVTSRTRQLFHLPPEEKVYSEDFLRVIHPDDYEGYVKARQRAIESNTGFFFEYRIIGPDGDIRWISTRGKVCKGIKGRSDQLMGFSIDITDMKRAEMELQALKEELFDVTRVAELGLLTASITHEINQPLSAIRSNAEAALRLLAKDKPDLPEVREALRDIVDDDTRAVEVIRRLRGLLRKGEQKREAIDMNDIIHHVVTIMSGEAAIQGFVIRLELDERLPAVMGDSIQLQQIILNMLQNGAEAVSGAQGGIREIAVRSRADSPDSVMISVSDSGAGIAESDMERIFDAFYTTKPHGMGMGLAVSRSIAIAHGGRLWASRGKSGGAVFHLRLPTA